MRYLRYYINKALRIPHPNCSRNDRGEVHLLALFELIYIVIGFSSSQYEDMDLILHIFTFIKIMRKFSNCFLA